MPEIATLLDSLANVSETRFIELYRAITHVTEIQARCAFILYDATHSSSEL